MTSHGLLLSIACLLAQLFVTSATAEPRLMADLQQEQLEAALATSVEAYKEVGKRDPAWDEQAIAFLEAVAMRWVAHVDAPSLQELEEMGRDVITVRGCDDPLVVYAWGYVWDNLSRNPDAAGLLKRATESLESQGYPMLRVANAKARYANHLKASDTDPELVQMLYDESADAYIESVRRGEYAEFNWISVDDLISRVNSDLPSNTADRLTDELLRLPRDVAPEWVVETILGAKDRRKAWRARGGGFAGTVTEDGWRGFGDYMTSARDHLERAWELNPENHYAALEMMNVAMSGYASDGEDIRTWFDRARGLLLDWEAPYRAMLWDLRPRWHGSHEEMLEFGEECAATNRYDTIVPYQYVVAVCDITSELRSAGDHPFDIWALEEVNTRVDDVLARLAAHPAHQRDAQRYKTMRAVAAWVAGDWAKARSIIDELGGILDKRAVESTQIGVSVNQVVEDIALSAGGTEALVHSARLAWVESRHDDAIAIYESMLEQAGDDVLRVRALLNRIAAVRMSKALMAGEWVDISFDEAISGWTAWEGHWRRIDDRSVEGTVDWSTADERELRLLLNVGIGGRFELTGQIDMSSAKGPIYRNAAILCHWTLQDDQWNSVMFYPDANKIDARHYFHSSELEDAEFEETFDFKIQVWDGSVVVWVDNERVFADEFSGNHDPEGHPQIGIGAWARDMTGSIRFGNLRLRYLSAGPAALNNTAPY